MTSTFYSIVKQDPPVAIRADFSIRYDLINLIFIIKLKNPYKLDNKLDRRQMGS